MTATPDRLDRLNEAARAANNPLFRHYVVGALSLLVDDETWDKAMETARKCDADYPPPPATADTAPAVAAYTPPF